LGLLLLAAPIVVQAQFSYSVNPDNTVTITGYTGSGGEATIPANTNGLTVTTVEESAFYNCGSLSSLTIAYGITNIGEQAFEFSGLTNVSIPGSVTSIGAKAFGSCRNLTSVFLTGNVPPQIRLHSLRTTVTQ
jgi:hypothetical protein